MSKENSAKRTFIIVSFLIRLAVLLGSYGTVCVIAKILSMIANTSYSWHFATDIYVIIICWVHIIYFRVRERYRKKYGLPERRLISLQLKWGDCSNEDNVDDEEIEDNN